MYEFHSETLQFWAELTVIALLVLLGAYAVRNRRVPAAKPFAAVGFLGAAAMICLSLEQAAVDPATMFFWYCAHTLLMLCAMTATVAFCLEYAYPGRWLTRRNVSLAALPCVMFAIALVIPSWRGLLWYRFEIGDWVMGEMAPLGVALLVYAWALLLLNLAALGWLFVRSPQHRRPLALLIGGQVGSRLIFAMQFVGPATGRSPDLIFLSTAVAFSMYALALFGFRLFDPLPGAFAAAVQQMREGMLVFDADGLLLNLNPAAARMLRTRAGRRGAKTWADIFPDLPRPGGGSAEAVELTLGPGGAERRYSVELTPLADQRGLSTGLLVLLHDVTEQRASQARAAEQHWARAVLQEREHLAHELHDGLSQDLAYLNVQAQAAQLYLAGSQFDAANGSLDRLATAARDMQRDTRELIGNLLFVSLSAEGFYAALCDLLRRFESQTGVRASLVADARAEAACLPQSLPAATAVELLRIAQESLANVRKHAGAPSSVVVSLAALDGQLRLTIEDDGSGFDPGCLADGALPECEHYGLQVMRSRAERFGGRVAVASQPGAGTQVTVYAPLREGSAMKRAA